jgi:integration host factor subunit beta
MTKADLVEQVPLPLPGLGPMISKKDCARVVDAFLDAIKDALKGSITSRYAVSATFKIRKRKTRWRETRAR